MQIQKLKENDLELFYRYAKVEDWDIEDIHIRSLLQTHPNDFFIFYQDTLLIGYVVALKESSEFGFISSLLVLKKFRGLGYGAKIFSFALEHLKGCQIALDSDLGQEGFYEKFGFSAYFDVNVYMFLTGAVDVKEDIFEVSAFDNSLYKKQDEYMKTILLDKGVDAKVIKSDTNSLAFAFAYKDGYKVTLKTQDINHALALFFALCSEYEHNTPIYIYSTPQETMLEALSEGLKMKKISHQTRMYNKILS